MAKNASLNKTASTTRKSRAAKSADAVVTTMHAETIEGQDELNSLIASLGGEVVEHVPTDATPAPAAAALTEAVSVVPDATISDALLEAAVGSAEAAEAAVAAASTEATPDGAAPTEGAAKKERATRKHYTDKVERLKDRVGDKLSEYSVLTVADAPVDDAALAETMARTLDIIRAMNSKEKNRAANLIEFLSGKKAKLNNVLERVLRVLDRDGVITTGNEGNVFKDLIARPYSAASARAMGGNTIGMFADLKLILADGKGKFIANPDSLLLMKARSLLAAAAAAPVVAAAAAAEPADDTTAPAAAATSDADAELAAALM